MSLVLVCPAVAFAQTGAASLTGIVTVQTGAVVPGATVTATNVDYNAVSNEAGNYTVSSLPVVTYVVKTVVDSRNQSGRLPARSAARATWSWW